MIRRAFLGGAALLAIAAAMPGQVLADASDGQIAAVIDEGLNRSEAMVMASQLMDGIGPRPTNSQNYRRASDWATQRMTAMGLQNVRREQSDFGLGWNVESFRAAMGAGKVVTGKTGGTDHVFMQAIGLPGYQFIQDPLDYDSRVHHTSIDTLDRLRGDDLRRAATVMAAMLLQAANSDRDLPRMPLPSKPVPTDPFKIRDPDE